MTEHSGPTLTDAKGMGGVNAQDGFDYQVWDALIRLPAWLRAPVFEGLVVEGLEDVEARFFAPHAPRGRVLDRFQAKSGMLTRGEVGKVFRGFAEFDRAHPGLARVQVLVTPALPTDLQWLARDPNRVRFARPFYAPFPDVLTASERKLEQDIIQEFGGELGPTVARSVEVALRNLPDRRTAESMFAAALDVAFPGLDPGPRKAASAFGTLAAYLAAHRGQMVDRADLLGILAATLDDPRLADIALPVHVRSDRNAPEADALEIDASPFSGLEGPAPSQEAWQSLLLEPLGRTARWAHSRRLSRLRLTGSYRITTAFALGWSFRAATGFELEIATRGGDWATDERPGKAAGLPWRITAPERLQAGRLAVSVGVLRDPTPQVVTSLGAESEGAILTAFLNQAISSGQEAQASAQIVKGAVAEAASRLAPQAIDLFFAGPAALAVVIAHRWNAMPTTQLYEFRQGQGYVRSAVLL